MSFANLAVIGQRLDSAKRKVVRRHCESVTVGTKPKVTDEVPVSVLPPIGMTTNGYHDGRCAGLGRGKKQKRVDSVGLRKRPKPVVSDGRIVSGPSGRFELDKGVLSAAERNHYESEVKRGRQERDAWLDEPTKIHDNVVKLPPIGHKNQNANLTPNVPKAHIQRDRSVPAHFCDRATYDEYYGGKS